MTRGRLYVVALVTLVVMLAINNALMKPHAPQLAPTVHGAGQTRAAATAPTTSVVPAAQRQTAPELKIPFERGKPTISLAAFKGKVVILDFWATWCGPCKESIPDLEKLYKKYHSQGLEVVGISVDDSAEPIPATVKELGMTYPVVLGREMPDIRSKFDFQGIPQMYVVDKLGRIAASYEGFDPTRDIETEIKPLFAE